MTKEEFDNTGWTCGMTAEYNGHTYKIASCDFGERTVGLLCGGPGTEGDGITWVHCECVKVNPPNAGGEFRRDSDVNSTALLADSGW